MKTRVILIRHAECVGNVENKLSGRTDFSLTERGIEQAKKLAQHIKRENINVIYSSPLKRAKLTAQYIAEYCNINGIKIDANIEEISYGVCDGMCWDDINVLYPNVHKLWKIQYHYPIGMPNQEDYVDLQNRMKEAIQKIINNNIGKKICIVSHGIAIYSYLCYLHEFNIEKTMELKSQKNTAYTIIEYNKSEYKILCEGECPHLN